MNHRIVTVLVGSITALVVGCANGEVDDEVTTADEATENVETTTQALSGTCGSGSSWQCVGMPGNTYQNGGICWYNASTGNCSWTCGGMLTGCRR